MNVKVRLQSASQPIEFEGVEGTYQKGDFFCLIVGDRAVKFPMATLFSVTEDYGYHEEKKG